MLGVVRQRLALNGRFISAATRSASTNVDPGSDKQEDSSADAGALKDSRDTAKEADNVLPEKKRNEEAAGDANFDPEVEDKSGKGFPHQTAEERRANLATTTEGESPVKTREYTPKEGSKIYKD